MKWKLIIISILILSVLVVAISIKNSSYFQDTIFADTLEGEKQYAKINSSSSSITLDAHEVFKGWKIFSYGNESIYYDVNLIQDRVCMIPKFNGTITRNESYFDEISNKSVEKYVDYTQPTTLKLTAKSLSLTLVKSNNQFCHTLNKTQFLSYKFGESSIILVGETSFNSLDTNVTQETGFAHLNISTNAPYDSLVLYIPFDTNTSSTTVFDYTNNDNDGTINNEASFNSSGKYGGSFDFDGVDDYIRVPDDPSISGLRAITFGAWFKAPNWNLGIHQIIGKSPSTGGAGREYRFRTETTVLVFQISNDGADPGAAEIRYAITNLKTNEWQHIMGTYDTDDSNALRLYVDGINVANGTGEAGPISDEDSDFTIATYTNEAFFYNISVDEVMVFNISLSASQILDIFNNQSARFADSGTQLFNNTNVSVLGTENRLNITLTNYSNLLSSNISVEINGSFFNLSNDGTINNLEFTDDPNFLNITFKYLAGAFNFQSPLNIGNTTLDSFVGGAEETIPQVTLRTPANNSIVTSNPITFIYNVTATTGVDNCSLIISDIVNLTDPTITLNTNQSFEQSFSNADFEWNVSCENSAGINVSLSFNLSVNVAADSCSPSSPLTANHIFECADDCDITTNINADGFNVSTNGTGTLTLNANITNYDLVHLEGESSTNRCRISCFGGGCFRDT